MLKTGKYILLVILQVASYTAFAGNPDRSGEAGAYELLINPWARSAGVFGMNSSRVEGIEAMRVNVGGLAFASRTEAIFSRKHWLQGSDIFVNTLGVAQKFGKDKSSVLGLSFMSLDLGTIDITTATLPEGGSGTFKPSFFNMGLAYSRAFSNRIYAGALIRIVSEKIEDLRAFGFCVDLGIQYVTGPLNNIRFGIALRNVGTPMTFGGNGLSFRGDAPTGDYQMTLNMRAEKFELPSLLNIGASYDLYADNIKNDENKNSFHRITIMFNFTSNSFGKDQVGGGIEYAWREFFMVRGGYRWEKGITKSSERTSAFLGYSAGFTAQVPIKKDGPPAIAIDYAYQGTNPFSGTHTYGVKLTLGPGPEKGMPAKKERKRKKKDTEEE